MTYFGGWAFKLGGVILTDGCVNGQEVWDGTECSPALVLDVLTDTADGLDLPALRTEDVTYYQRDGVTHFSDWYEPRFITLRGTLGPVDACACDDPDNCVCLTIRQQLSELVQEWKRTCCDTEIVIYPPCDVATVDEDRMFTGPFGVVGRPRVFTYKWNYHHTALDFVARFDGVDQRIYILDDCGTPGYTECVEIQPGNQDFTVCFEDGTGDYLGQKVMCFGGAGFCFDNPVTSDDSVDPVEVAVGGTEKVSPTITLFPPLTRPYVENITDDEYVQLDMYLTDTPVVINTEDGTAFDANGNSLTHLLRGNPFLGLYPGNYEWRLLAAGSDDVEEPGYASLCWRNTIVNA